MKNCVEVIDTTLKNKATYEQTSSKESPDFSHGVCQEDAIYKYLSKGEI